jgi:gliding motility-associated-like protein
MPGVMPAFSPNGDLAQDQWNVRCPCAAYARVRVSDPINGYNIVYQQDTRNRSLQWDGVEQVSGNQVKAGNYVYEVDIQQFDGIVHKLSGNVSVLQ